MTEAVVWLVLWILFAFVGAGAIFGVFALGGGGLAAATDKIWIAPIAVVIGWLGAAAWFIFAAIQVILQIISVVQLASGG